ncbi:MAG: HAD hydrolase family protein [Planctomycetes bacterium]|nr:HAD hydrolase family protein [Planctomycetota bacterium]
MSGRSSPIVAARARDLGVEDVVQGREDKLEPFLELVRAWALTPEQVCYVGDDTADLPPMRASGFAVAVANAASDVKAIANHVTQARGGAGAVREIVDYLLNHSETK